MNWIVRSWSRYISGCDRMGLTPENRRSCAPRLEDPELSTERNERMDRDVQSHASISANKTKREL